jgi:transposase
VKGAEVYVKIQELKQKGYSQRQVKRQEGISRGTVRKYWEMSEDEYAQYRITSKSRFKKLDEHREYIIAELKKHSEITGAIIHDHLLEHNPEFEISASAVREYVALLREELGLPRMVKIRQYTEVSELPAGFQAQVDMGEKVMKDFYGNKVKIIIFAMVLSHSRKKYVYFQDHKFNAEEFVKAHDMAFRYFGGRTAEIVYDQDRVMSVSENAGDLVLTEAFENYQSYAGFSIRLCRGSDPESKGKIESAVKYVKNNFLSCRDYPGISRLNTEGLSWLERTANEKKHETTYMVPNRVFVEEIRHLKAVPELSESEVPKTAIIRKTNVVHYKRNRYEVPKGTYQPGKHARIEVDGESVRLYDSKTEELLAEHTLYTGFGKLIPLPRNAERYKTNKYDELKTAVLSWFNNSNEAELFVGRIIEKYPRYIRDQLTIIKKLFEQYSKGELSKALEYCIEHELFSANDFRDTLEYFRTTQPPLPVKEVVLPVKYSIVKAEVRDLSVYSLASELGGVRCE